MLRSIDRITWRNGFRLNGIPATAEDIEPVFEERLIAKKWELYEQKKAELRQENLSSVEYQKACFQLAYMLGI